jgi:YfiH family protein
VSDGVYGVRSGDGNGLNLATHVGDDPDRVGQNRQIARDLMDLPPVIYMDQVHGNDVAVVSRFNIEQTPQADALVTKERGIALAVLIADCVPLMLADFEMGVIAAVHVGRRGLANGIVQNAVRAMQSLGVVSIRAVMGPAICGDCYEVPLEMQREIGLIAPQARSITDSGTPGLDIRDGVAWQLARLSIDSTSDPICTRRSELHYSYRREGITGRTAGFIHLL